MKTTVSFTVLFSGTHCWPECNIPEVAYLKDTHRHVFHIKGEIEVTHDNRDIEFIRLKREVTDYLNAKYPKGDLGSNSCEMIAADLLYVFSLCKCEVFEDGENGATVYADREQSIATYKDPSESSRKSWSGKEVEGRLKGLSTRFITKLSGVEVPEENHVYLCPTIAQNEHPAAIEEFVYRLCKQGKVVTVAIKPQHTAKLTPVVRMQAHIMIDIDAHGLEWLKPTDTIKIEIAPYTTLATSREQMTSSTLKDYNTDTHLE